MTAHRLLSSAAFFLASVALANSNIDPAHKFGWSENAGWMNWRDAGSPLASQGVNVGGSYLAGYIWMENAGWVNVGNGAPANGTSYANANGSDFGVNIALDRSLSGMAWGENIGWINFSGGASASPPQPVRIDCQGRLHGVAWSENIGWINLMEAETGNFVSVDAATTPYACDMNHDGASNGRDVQAFINALLAGGANWRDVCSGDANASHTLDLGDVPAFVACLLE